MNRNRSDRPRSSPLEVRPLAVFDLDGTLVRGDTLLPFLVSYAWRSRHLWPLVTLPVYLALYAFRLLSARAAKQVLLISFLRGQSRLRVSAHAHWFCDRWVRGRLHEQVMAKVREHQRLGHRVILLSASPEVYVHEIARFLGIEEILCTRVAGDAETWDGAIRGDNCKGQVKLRLLQHFLQEDGRGESYSYADQADDMAVLRWTTVGYLVNRQGGLQRL